MTAGRLRLVLNALPLEASGGGVSTYIRELLRSLTEVVDAELVVAVRPSGLAVLPSGLTPLVTRESRGVRRALAGALGFGPADLTHGLDVDLPVRRPGPTVSTVHDMAVFDVPGTFPRHRVAGERLLVRAALRRADVVVAVSAFTAERVRSLTGRDAVVVHEAPGHDMVPARADAVSDVRARYRLPERFVLHVGNIEARKDLATLAEACERAGVALVVTGHGLWGARAPRGVLAIGHVPEADLPALYGAATLVGYASRYEGFGLPPVEAMACGAAVVSTPVPSVDEVVGPGAATFRPGDVEGLTGTLRDLLADDDRRAELARCGAGLVRSLSWRRNALATAGVYRSLGVAV